MTLISQSKRIDWAMATSMALAVVALTATCASATIIEANGSGGSSNADVPSDYGSNATTTGGGISVANGTTPNVALTWHPVGSGFEFHGSPVWNHVDPANSGVDIVQVETVGVSGPPAPAITFTVANGFALQLNSLDIGHATDQNEPAYSWTITISNLTTSVEEYTHTTSAMAAGDVETVTFNFTGEDGVDYRLTFSPSAYGLNRTAIDNLSFNQVDAAGIVWSAETTSAITINSATAAASVDTDLTEAVLVWEETTTAPNPGGTNDWTYHPSLGPQSAGPVTAPISSLSADTEYTWRFYGETASTNGWSAATTFVTAFSGAQAPAFTNAEALSFSSIQLNWEGNAVHQTGYLLRRSPNSGSGPYTTMDVGNTTTYSDSGLSAGSTYYYELAATNSANGSATDFSKCVTNATTKASPAGVSTVGLLDLFDPDEGVTTNASGIVTDWGNLAAPGRSAAKSTDTVTLTTGGTTSHTMLNFLSANNNGHLGYTSPGDGSMSAGYTIFAVVELSDWTSTANPRAHTSDTDSHALYETGGSIYVKCNPAASRPSAAFTLNTLTILTARLTSDERELYYNGVRKSRLTGTTADYSLSNNEFRIGNSWIGKIGHVLVYDGTATTNELGQTGAFLASEYGLTWDDSYLPPPPEVGTALSSSTVPTNAVPGTHVGYLSYTTNDQSGITYSLPVTATGPDSGSFQITSVTNLRTAATIAQASYAISIEAHSGGESLGTNDFTITVDPVASTYSAFIVAAEVASGVASGGELLGVLQAEGADPSAFTFSLNSGRTDLFEIDGTGTNLVQVGGTDPGLAGAVNYIRIQAANAAATNDLVVAVQVVDGTPSGTLFLFR